MCQKMIKMVIFCVIAFALTWMPFNALLVMGDVHPEIWEHQNIMYVWCVTHFLAMCHTITNPLIYIWMNNRFRAGFKKSIVELYRPVRSSLVFVWYQICCLGCCFSFSHRKYRQMRLKMAGQASWRLATSGSLRPKPNNNNINKAENPLPQTTSGNLDTNQTTGRKYSLFDAKGLLETVDYQNVHENHQTANHFSGSIQAVNSAEVYLDMRALDRHSWEANQVVCYEKASQRKRLKRAAKRCKECNTKSALSRRPTSACEASQEEETSALGGSIALSVEGKSLEERRPEEAAERSRPRELQVWLFRKSNDSKLSECASEQATAPAKRENQRRRRRYNKQRQSHMINIELTTREDCSAAGSRMYLSSRGTAATPLQPEASTPQASGQYSASAERSRKSARTKGGRSSTQKRKPNRNPGSEGSERQCPRCKMKVVEQTSPDINRQSSLSTATISIQTNTTSLQVSSLNSTEVHQHERENASSSSSENNKAFNLNLNGAAATTSTTLDTSPSLTSNNTKMDFFNHKRALSLQETNRSQTDTLREINNRIVQMSTQSIDGQLPSIHLESKSSQTNHHLDGQDDNGIGDQVAEGGAGGSGADRLRGSKSYCSEQSERRPLLASYFVPASRRGEDKGELIPA